MQDSRMVRIRNLKDETARLKEELARVRDERDSLRQHFSLALMAARDADAMPPDCTLLVIDGWNAILGSGSLTRDRTAKDATRPVCGQGWRKQLVAMVQSWLDRHPGDRAWIVFDGHQANGEVKGRLRISYTGGMGSHRADRFVCDYLRMRLYSGVKTRIVVVTNDKGFRADAKRLGAEISGVEQLNEKSILSTSRE